MLIRSLLAAVTLLAVVPTTQAHASRASAVDPVRIMVAGDSISHGSSGDWTWRYRLAKHLAAKRVRFDLVGPRNDMENIMSPQPGDGDQTYADPAFDTDHNATWGRPLWAEAGEIGAKVTQYHPDYLFVLLGINDLGWFGHDGARLEQDMRAFIGNARAAKPGIRIIIGRLLPTRRASDDLAFAGRVADTNARYAAVALELNTAASPVRVAASDAEFVAAQHTWDGTHPNPRGELRIAAAFADRLATDFGVGTTYPRNYPNLPLGPRQVPLLTVTATGPGTADLGWTPSVGATAYWVWVKDGMLNPEWTRLPFPLTQDHNPWHMEQLQSGATYHYRVQPTKGDNAGVFSNVATLTMP